MKRCRLDRAGIMFVVDLITGGLTSPTHFNNVITAEIKKIIKTLTYWATREITATVMIWVCPVFISRVNSYSTFSLLYCDAVHLIFHNLQTYITVWDSHRFI